jgi:hypothetical protein
MRLSAAALAAFAAAAILASLPALDAQEKPNPRDVKVKGDKASVEADGYWIYDDFEGAVAKAKAAGKPLLVVFRCIPCEACAHLDEQVVERDAAIRPLLDKFVCVRIPRTNGIDLALFQYDWDQSWAAFFLEPDMTILGRYGTRSHRTDSDRDVSIQGLAKSMEAVLALRARLGEVRDALAAKRGPKPEFATPEALPSLAGKYTDEVDWAGKPTKSCIHCHQVGEGLRQVWRKAGKAIPAHLLHPYPNPRDLGIEMDPKEAATVASVAPGSLAEKDGVRAGDVVESAARQPVVSVADITWVLHHAPDAGSVELVVRRAGKAVPVKLTLREGWRAAIDISWRVSSWDLRRMVFGGLVLEEADDAGRKAAGIKADAMALRVKHVGQYGDHAVAKAAGFRKDDLVTAIDGKSARRSESDVITELVTRTKPGDTVTFDVLRDGKTTKLAIKTQ